MTRVKVYVTPKKGILDPQGKTVESALQTLGYKNVAKVQVGKYLEFELQGLSGKKQENQIEEMCKKLLANPVIEDYRYEVE